jgi:serine protease inhibitor
MDKVLEALQTYARNFYSETVFEDSNIVASPLGSWLFVASIANNLDYTANPSLKESLEKCLQMTLEDAAAGVDEILVEYPALNYVVKAWTVENLSTLPAVQKWVEKNTLIPHEGRIPKQEEIDSWVAENTNELIKTFPSDMANDPMLIIANIIYSKLTWKTKFVPVPATGAMTVWGVENVLHATATRDVSFYKNETDDIFVIYNVRATGTDKESVVLISCLTNDLEPAVLLSTLDDVNSMERIYEDDELLLTLSNESYRVKEVRKGTSPTLIHVTTPAWEASSKHDLLDNSASGFQELATAFMEDAQGNFNTDAKQVAVAKFDKEGFEAAALTTMIVGRCAAPILMEQTVYELNFTKPFAYVSFTGKLPVFSGYVQVAKEG